MGIAKIGKCLPECQEVKSGAKPAFCHHEEGT